MQLLETMEKHGAAKAQELDINALMAKTVFDISGEALLGYTFNSFAEDGKDSFAESVKHFLYVFLLPCVVLI